MNLEKKLDGAARSIADECRSDFVGLWGVVWRVKDVDPAIIGPAVRSSVLRVVQSLLEDFGIVAGQFAEGSCDFIEWDMDSSACLNRIESEWNELGREPDIGEIAWFAARDRDYRAVPLSDFE